MAEEESRASTASAAMRSSSGSTASVKRAGFTPARAVRAAERTGSCSLRSRSRSSSTVATWAGSPDRPALPTSSAQAVARSSAAGPRVAARSCSRPSSKGRWDTASRTAASSPRARARSAARRATAATRLRGSASRSRVSTVTAGAASPLSSVTASWSAARRPGGRARRIRGPGPAGSGALRASSTSRGSGRARTRRRSRVPLSVWSTCAQMSAPMTRRATRTGSAETRRPRGPPSTTGSRVGPNRSRRSSTRCGRARVAVAMPRGCPYPCHQASRPAAERPASSSSAESRTGPGWWWPSEDQQAVERRSSGSSVSTVAAEQPGSSRAASMSPWVSRTASTRRSASAVRRSATIARTR